MSGTKRKRVLVVGDWVVDEYWVTADQRSRTASRKGNLPLRARHDLHSPVLALAGAGRVAELLHNAKHLTNDRLLDVVGFGIWHSADTKYIGSMFDSANLTEKNPHRLNPGAITSTNHPHLVNLGEFLRPHDDGTIPAPYGTNRVIRVFQRDGERIELLGRLDWELSPEGRDRKGDRYWAFDSKSGQKNSLAKRLLPNNEKFDAIVIKDLCKGVISRPLLNYLIAECTQPGETMWFISTKEWRNTRAPDSSHWSHVFSNPNLAQLSFCLIPPIAADDAIGDGKQPYEWFTPSKRSPRETFEAIEALDSFYPRQNNCICAVLKEDYRFLMRGPTGDIKRWGARQPKAHEPDIYYSFTEVQMASVFFPHLVASVIKATPKPEDWEAWTALSADALAYAKEFGENEEAWLRNPSGDYQRQHRSISVKGDGRAFLAASPKEKLPAIVAFDWLKAQSLWEAARVSGVIDSKGKRIELFRAMCELDGYICCLDDKRQCLATWINHMKSFADARRSGRHMSGVIHAPPGVGKTHLVSSLRDTLSPRIEYEEINIAQLTRRDQLIDFFDKISSIQVRQRRKKVFVFVDEINAPLEELPVYGLFLSLLEEGVYLRGSNKITLAPCMWIFAGTADEDEIRSAQKGADFFDRLTLPLLSLKVSNAIERKYLGVAMVRGRFKEVDRITQTALESIAAKETARELRKYIDQFTGVTEAQVSGRNTPEGAALPSATPEWVIISDGPYEQDNDELYS